MNGWSYWLRRGISCVMPCLIFNTGGMLCSPFTVKVCCNCPKKVEKLTSTASDWRTKRFGDDDDSSSQQQKPTISELQKQVVRNLGKAYAKVLTVTDKPLTTMEVLKLHDILFENTDQEGVADPFAREPHLAVKFNQVVNWIAEEMVKQKIDRVTLAAISQYVIWNDTMNQLPGGPMAIAEDAQKYKMRHDMACGNSEYQAFNKFKDTNEDPGSRDPRLFVNYFISSLNSAMDKWTEEIELACLSSEMCSVSNIGQSSYPLLKNSTSSNDESFGTVISNAILCSSPKADVDVCEGPAQEDCDTTDVEVAQLTSDVKNVMPTTFAEAYREAIRYYCPHLLDFSTGPSANLTGFSWMFKEP
uniref:Uncharacterized protein n=1 Tax=Ditylenchus dipsaci TaxID=166011 RepID=A0A915EIY4_9BILA